MKNILILLLAVLSFTACNKDDDQSTQDPISQLPEATQTGENTIGCLVNGEPLLPKGSLGLNYQCFYQYIEGEYYFGLSFDHDYFKNGKNVSKHINITLQKLEIFEDEKYDLNNHFENTFNDDIWGGGRYSYSPSVLEGIIRYNTTQIHSGELKIRP